MTRSPLPTRALLSALGVLGVLLAGVLLALTALWTIRGGHLPTTVTELPTAGVYGSESYGRGAYDGAAHGADPPGGGAYGGGAYGAEVYGLHGGACRPGAGCPPFAAILFLPVSWLPAGALPAVFAAVNAALLALLVLFAGRVARPGPILAATGVALGLETLFPALLPGQAGLALACLVLWDLSRSDGSLGKGFALGIAAGITLTPAVFLVYLLCTGRIRAALTGVGALAGTVALGALVLPATSAEFWSDRFAEALRAARPWEFGADRPAAALASPYPLIALALLVAAAWRLCVVPASAPGASPGAALPPGARRRPPLSRRPPDTSPRAGRPPDGPPPGSRPQPGPPQTGPPQPGPPQSGPPPVRPPPVSCRTAVRPRP